MNYLVSAKKHKISNTNKDVSGFYVCPDCAGSCEFTCRDGCYSTCKGGCTRECSDGCVWTMR